MRIVTPMAMRTGLAMPTGVFGALALPNCCATARQPASIAVGDPDRAEDGHDADDPERDLGPLRTDREAILPPPPPAGDEAVDDADAGEAADHPAERLAERTVGPPPSSWKFVSSGEIVWPGRFLEGEAAQISRPPRVTMKDGTPR